MKIHIYTVPNDLIARYCKVIKDIETRHVVGGDALRVMIHNEIFKEAGCNRSLFKRDDRLFSIELDRLVNDLLDDCCRVAPTTVNLPVSRMCST